MLQAVLRPRTTCKTFPRTIHHHFSWVLSPSCFHFLIFNNKFFLNFFSEFIKHNLLRLWHYIINQLITELFLHVLPHTNFEIILTINHFRNNSWPIARRIFLPQPQFQSAIICPFGAWLCLEHPSRHLKHRLKFQCFLPLKIITSRLNRHILVRDFKHFVKRVLTVLIQVILLQLD